MSPNRSTFVLVLSYAKLLKPGQMAGWGKDFVHFLQSVIEAENNFLYSVD